MPKTIEIFKRGTQTDSAGNKITFDDVTLEGITSFANTGAFKVPGVIGHPKDNDPAVCWGHSYSYSRETGVLTAEVDETDPAFAEMLTKRMYDKVSPNSPEATLYAFHNPDPKFIKIFLPGELYNNATAILEYIIPLHIFNTTGDRVTPSMGNP